MKEFSTTDYVMVVTYVVAITIIGSAFYRRRSTPKDYFLGGRAMWWLPTGISIIAADLSAISVMGTPSWAYRHNLELIWHSVGYIVVAPLVIRIFVPFYASLGLYTAYEYLERRFNLAVRLLTSFLFLSLRSVHIAIVLYAPALVISFVTGIAEWKCILLMGAFTTLYTTLGGIKAVIWTDVLQFCTIIVSFIFIFYTSISHTPGGLATAWETALAHGKLNLFNFSTDPRELTSFWASLLGGVVLCMGPLVTDQAILQRLFATKSVEDCRRAILLQAALILPVLSMLYLAGTAIFVFVQHNPDVIGALPNDDAIVPAFAVRALPAGVSGLVIAAIFSASMAVMSASINSLTTATTVDFYQRLRKTQFPAEHYAVVGRFGSVAWGVVVTVMALYAGRLGELALAYNRVSSVIFGPLLAIFLLAALTTRTTAVGALLGAAAGSLSVLAILLRYEWSFFWLGPIGLVNTFVASYLFSLLTPPPPSEKIAGLTYSLRGQHIKELKAMEYPSTGI